MWNSYGNQSLNGIPYESPAGFVDRGFDYVFPPLETITPGVPVLTPGVPVEFQQFSDQGSIFVWFGLEVPPAALPNLPPPNPYQYKATVQIFLDEEMVFTDDLNLVSAFGNQNTPFPIFPVRYLPPGTRIRIVVTSFDIVDYYNFTIVMRGLKRYQAKRYQASVKPAMWPTKIEVAA